MLECTECLMNSQVDPTLHLDEKGVCNYCTNYHKAEEKVKQRIDERHFEHQINAIKQSTHPQYDCILGVSGGTDSSYVAYLLKKEGLRVLMVHCDNGWDTDLAVQNLQKIKEKTGFDLLIRKVDTIEFYKAQKSFIQARVVDIELLSDHINIASIYEVANEKNISWIVTGENINTEYFMPPQWVHNKNDWRQIKDIDNRFEKSDTSSFPSLGPYRKFFIQKRLNLQYFKPLNCISYNKHEATKILNEAFDWVDHGGKHFESHFTIFFQCYLLPQFFNIDKRIPHLSNLICSQHLTRAEALRLLAEDIISPQKLQEVKAIVFEKLQCNPIEFENMMKQPICLHSDYRSHFIYQSTIQSLLQPLRQMI